MAGTPQELSSTQQKRLAEFIEPFRVTPGTKVTLAKDFDPAYKAGVNKKKDGVTLLEEGVRRWPTIRRGWPPRRRTGARRAPGDRRRGQGRDDPPRHERGQPAGGAGPQLKAPSAEELGHDFLWRYRGATGAGQIGIFNRSHYEEVLVVRVHPEILDRQEINRRRARTVEAALPRDQRMGAAPGRERGPGS